MALRDTREVPYIENRKYRQNMTKKPLDEISLDDAYALETPQDSINLYTKWAETYDQSFAKEYDYNAPDIIAEDYARLCHDKTAPVLDIGAGTGLVGEGLVKREVLLIDALDITAQMLEVAGKKNTYRNLILGDLTQTLDIADNSYGGITSSGTFTHGHVGPEAFDELIRIGRPGALYVLSIRSSIFETAGFKAKFDSLSGKIRDFEVIEKSLYGKSAKPELQNSTSSVTIFRKA